MEIACSITNLTLVRLRLYLVGGKRKEMKRKVEKTQKTKRGREMKNKMCLDVEKRNERNEM